MTDTSRLDRLWFQPIHPPIPHQTPPSVHLHSLLYFPGYPSLCESECGLLGRWARRLVSIWNWDSGELLLAGCNWCVAGIRLLLAESSRLSLWRRSVDFDRWWLKLEWLRWLWSGSSFNEASTRSVALLGIAEGVVGVSSRWKAWRLHSWKAWGVWCGLRA